ncbi:MAG: ABC transporter permease [Bacteroidota bacterium]
MLKHTLTLAFRNFFRQKTSFLINLIGLSTGLACAMLIYLWIYDEQQMDAAFEQNGTVFQVMEHQQYADEIMTTLSTPGLLAQTLAEEVPEIEYGATLYWPSTYTLSVGEKNIRKTGRFVGEDFLHILNFPLIEGNPSQVLKDLNTIILTRGIAETLFGSTEAAIGKTVELDHEESYAVRGVCEDVSPHSSLQFDFLLNYQKYLNENDWLRPWGNNSPQTLVRLKPGTDPDFVSEKIAGFIAERNENSNVTLFLKPYKERYLHSRYENGKLVGGRIEYIRLFSIIALFIIVIACINFMNLSTARATKRAKEIGIKKAVGAEKRLLTWQFLTESLVIASLSFVLAILLVFLVLPFFNELTEKQMSLLFGWEIWGVFIGLTLLTGLIAGSYPALYLSGFKPVEVLKGTIKGSLGELWARKGLVVFQFTLSLILIVAVLVVYRQIQFVQTQNLGYDKENLVYFPREGNMEDRLEVFIEEASKLPGIQSISSSAHGFVGRQNNTSGLNWEGKDPQSRILFEHMRVNYGMIEILGVEMLEGRSFSEDYGADSSKIIFNETAIEIMGFEDPIGKKIRLWDEYDMEIIGVVKDFHFQSMHEEMNPLFFRLDQDISWNIIARLDPGKEKEALAALSTFYSSFNPGFTLAYKFIDEEYANLYEAEMLVGTLSRYFAGLAILISCLGLLGLAAYTADRKKKEIGIRKVLGASVQQIILLLTRDFTQLVSISLLLGLPIAYYLTHSWLDQFAYKISLSPWFFLVAGILTLGIAWLTVSTQAYRSANVDPQECLRSE